MSKETGGPAFPTASGCSSLGMTLRAYYKAKAPVDFDLALRVWGDKDVDLHDDTTRAAFFAVWATLRGEYADAMLTEGFK